MDDRFQEWLSRALDVVNGRKADTRKLAESGMGALEQGYCKTMAPGPTKEIGLALPRVRNTHVE
jgi:hypothetical protein